MPDWLFALVLIALDVALVGLGGWALFHAFSHRD